MYYQFFIYFLTFSTLAAFTRVDATAQPQKERMTILNDGKVLIGITSITPPTVLHQELKLAVSVAIFAKEVLVRLDGWSDFVLDENYKLLPLDDLELRIKKDKHLPGIPSTEEVLKDGFLIGDMQSKVLKKIEEQVGNLRYYYLLPYLCSE